MNLQRSIPASASPTVHPRSTAAVLALLALLVLAGCGGHRNDVTPAALAQRSSDVSRAQAVLRDDIRTTLVNALIADRKAGRTPCIDVLVLSGGGSWGAFGAGFLNGWSELPADNPMAMPRFDLVTGVSTGALIAPFALVGTRASLQRIERLYRSTQEDWAPMRSWVDKIGASSLCDTDILDRTLREQLDVALARSLVTAQDAEYRQAIVTSSDVDLGRPIIWRLADRARTGLAMTPYDADPLFKVLRASAAIPGLFSPVEIDGAMQVDGALYGQIHIFSDLQDGKRFLDEWRQKAGADAPIPRIRIWVILNNRLRVTRKIIQPKWSDTALRSVELMLSSQISAPLNRLALFIEGLRLKYGIRIDLHWVQIPADWEAPPEVGDFHPSVTNSLCDLGLRMGRDPASWMGLEQLGDQQPDANEASVQARP